MHLTKVILVCNDNPIYYKFANDVYDIWKNYIKIQPHLFIITNDKSSIDIDFGDRTVQFITPIDNIPTSFQSQVIRLLLPCLFPDDFTIITDIDMIPLDKKMFKKYLKYLDNSIFLQHFQNFQICYNSAHGSVWRNIFGVTNISQIKPVLKIWYEKYKGIHVTDQLVLKDYLANFKGNRLTLTSYLPNKTVIKRLSTYNSFKIFEQVKLEELHEYIDLHAHNIFKYPDIIPYYQRIIDYLKNN